MIERPDNQPRSVVRVLVEMLAPYAGRVYGPARGSGGTFVQSETFAEAHGGNKPDVSIFGQESNPTTWRPAHMDLAIHGIEANLGPAPADTFLGLQHPDLKADFVLANLPFNVSDYSDQLLRSEKRWTFGISPRRATEQLVDYNIEPGNDDAWSNSWAGGQVCTPQFNNIQPIYRK